MKMLVMTWFFMGLVVAVVSDEVYATSGENDEVQEECPTDLSQFEGEMETVLESIFNESFKKTMRTSLQASIPEAIQRADGINAQIKYLHAQIREQNRSQSYAENVARKAADNMDDALVVCQSEEKGSYCDAVEQYYIGEASNLANHGFLAALECYKEQGMR